MNSSGTCECGAVTYNLKERTKLSVYACHCLACQLRSSSAFTEHVMVSESDLSLYGKTVSFSNEVDNSTTVEYFCATCFTRMYKQNSVMPDMVILRAGTLRDAQDLEPMMHIWTKRKQSWLKLPEDRASFLKSPTAEEFAEVIINLSPVTD
jgi:hypothetical protein